MPKISALHTIEHLTTSSLLPVVDSGETQKVSLQKVVEFVSASLEPTFATDIELLRSASAITSSLNAFASASVLTVATKLSTASFEAYTASVLVPNINSSSLLLTSSFNSFTQSYQTDSASFNSRINAATNEQSLSHLATTGSNVFKGNQTISGSLDVLIPGGTATGINENPTSNNIFWSYPSQDTNTANVQIGWNAVAEGLGNYIVTDVQYDTPYSPFISITLNDDVALPYRVRLNFSKPSYLWEFASDGTFNIPTSINGNGVIQLVGNIDLIATDKTYTFGTDGNLNVPGNIIGALNLATTGSNTFTDTQIAPSVIADQLTANDRAYVRRIAPIGNANIDVLGYVSSSYGITARQFIGDGRYLTNLSATTDWNYNQEYTIKKTEQLTFSGDYILEDTYLIVEGGIPNTIGEWEHRIGAHNGSISKTSTNTYLIEGPNSTGNASDGNLITQYFATGSVLSVDYIWNSEDAGNEFPTYDIQSSYPYEISTFNMLVNANAISESGTWTINVPDNSYLTFGVWSGNSDNLTSSLQLTLPYLYNEDNVKYSPNKYFKKEGKIFIGGNLLVKDSYIENNGQISVGGEVILIGNSQIAGTGTII